MYFWIKIAFITVFVLQWFPDHKQCLYTGSDCFSLRKCEPPPCTLGNMTVNHKKPENNGVLVCEREHFSEVSDEEDLTNRKEPEGRKKTRIQWKRNLLRQGVSHLWLLKWHNYIIIMETHKEKFLLQIRVLRLQRLTNFDKDIRTQGYTLIHA